MEVGCHKSMLLLRPKIYPSVANILLSKFIIRLTNYTIVIHLFYKKKTALLIKK